MGSDEHEHRVYNQALRAMQDRYGMCAADASRAISAIVDAGLHIVDAELPAEVERLQAINAHLSADIAAKVHDHREEVERLRAEHQNQYEAAQEWEMFCRQAESRLAAANALLAEVSSEWNRPERWAKRVKAHLAAQPATALVKQRSLNARCAAPLTRGLHTIAIVDGVKVCTLCRAGEQNIGPDHGEADQDYPAHALHFAAQPATAPTYNERVQAAAEIVFARTPLEQSVLDASAWGSPEMLRKVIKDYGYSAWVRMTAVAELARRGLKP